MFTRYFYYKICIRQDNEEDVLILEELEKHFQQWEGTISKMVFQDCFHYFEGAVVTSVSTYLSPSRLQKSEVSNCPLIIQCYS